MRNLSNLERLLKLKNEAININNEIEMENHTLITERDLLIEKNLASFIEELTELSKYGSAGNTEIKLDFYKSSYGDNPIIFHETKDNKFILKANPSGYSNKPILYDSNLGWDWYEEETKKFIAMNKDMILDAIEKKIAQKITKCIEDSSIVNKNIKLKNEIEQLKG